MPELPEVETTRRALEPLLVGTEISRLEVRERRLRWPVPLDLADRLKGQVVQSLRRRAKYLLLEVKHGVVLIHLGMSGSLRVTDGQSPANPHDHLDFCLANDTRIRLRDPRRFGAVLWAGEEPFSHPLLASLGVEPLGNEFSGPYLRERANGRRVAVKNFLMNAHIVVGVGNIYASEALFVAGIHPSRAAGRISVARYERLAAAVRAVLNNALEAGGTTLRDYVHGEGERGNFGPALKVYGRTGEPCTHCATTIRQLVIGQRSSFFCPACQR